MLRFAEVQRPKVRVGGAIPWALDDGTRRRELSTAIHGCLLSDHGCTVSRPAASTPCHLAFLAIEEGPALIFVVIVETRNPLSAHVGEQWLKHWFFLQRAKTTPQ